MTFLDIVLIALIQGLAGVLPLSASGHFALFSGLAGDPNGFAAVSVAVHLGAALGLMVWLWRDCWAMTLGVGRLVKGKADPGGRLLLKLVVASLPIGMLSLWLLGSLVPPHGQVLAAACLIGLGIVLALADRWGVTVSRIEHVGYGPMALIGAVQILALIPGVSRTGACITLSRLLGMERRDAARLAWLLAIPALAGMGLFKLWLLSRHVHLIVTGDLLMAMLIAGLAALFGAAVTHAWLGRHTYLPFCLWRVMLGIGVIGVYFLSA